MSGTSMSPGNPWSRSWATRTLMAFTTWLVATLATSSAFAEGAGHGGEANLKVPDLHSVTFLSGMR